MNIIANPSVCLEGLKNPEPSVNYQETLDKLFWFFILVGKDEIQVFLKLPVGLFLKLLLISRVATKCHVTPFVFVPENNKGFFIALIELHTQVRHSSYFLDCVTSEMPQHLVCLSHRTGVRPELALGPLMVLTPSFIKPEAVELKGLRISSPGNTNNLTREICLSLTHQQPSRQEWWCTSTL